MRLEINEEKTKIYDLTKEKMKYLGYDFYVSKCGQSKRYRVDNMLPKAKEDEIVSKCGELLRAIKENTCFETIHNWNVYVVGIHNYYKGMTHFYQSFNKIGWRIKKLFYHTMNTRGKFAQEQSYKNNFLWGRYRTWGKKGYYCFENYPVIEINWANWDSGLICHLKSRVARENPYHYGEKRHKSGVSLEAIGFLVDTSKYIKNSRLAMFRISKYSSVKGISYLSGEFVPVAQYHCHHIKPIEKGGTNDFNNLCVLSESEYNILCGDTPEQLYLIFPQKKKRIKYLINAL
jgi:hypothetical protein